MSQSFGLSVLIGLKSRADIQKKSIFIHEKVDIIRAIDLFICVNLFQFILERFRVEDVN
jgi:hypothetical protein